MQNVLFPCSLFDAARMLQATRVVRESRLLRSVNFSVHQLDFIKPIAHAQPFLARTAYRQAISILYQRTMPEYCPVLRPTFEEFVHTKQYIKSIEHIVTKHGICKVRALAFYQHCSFHALTSYMWHQIEITSRSSHHRVGIQGTPSGMILTDSEKVSFVIYCFLLPLPSDVCTALEISEQSASIKFRM